MTTVLVVATIGLIVASALLAWLLVIVACIVLDALLAWLGDDE